MNNLSKSQSPTLKENQEVFSYETMKGEFISIIDGLLKAYENSLYSDENIEVKTLQSLKQRLGNLENLDGLLFWISSIKKNFLSIETEINNFLFKYREQLTTEMFFGLLGSGRGEDTLKSILDNSKNTQTKMDVCIFVMKHHEERYRLYMPKIFEACISCMKDKIGTSYGTGKGCDIQDLKKIYKYYKENKATINPDLDVDGAFEIYSELFSAEDFKSDLGSLNCGDLPVSYVKMAFSGSVKKILDIRNTDDVEVGLNDEGVINVFLSNIDHGSHGLPGFSEKIELSNNEIYELQKLGYDSQDGLKMPDYIKSYTSLIRKILYFELNLRIYGDNEKIREGLTKKYIKTKKELDSMMSKILFLPEEKEFDFSNNNSGLDIEVDNEEGDGGSTRDSKGDKIPF